MSLIPFAPLLFVIRLRQGYGRTGRLAALTEVGSQESAAFVQAELKPTRSLVVARNAFMNIIVTSTSRRLPKPVTVPSKLYGGRCRVHLGKPGTWISRIFLILAFACAIFAGNGEARATSRGARLIVQRAPNFGNRKRGRIYIFDIWDEAQLRVIG